MEEILLTNNYDAEEFNEIKASFISKMKNYNIDFKEKDEPAIDIMINALINKDLDRDRWIYVVSGSPGMGKSVLIETYIEYQMRKYNGDYGCIVAKERIEDIQQIQNKFPDTHYALYGFRPEDCLKGMKTYNPNMCKICKIEDCRVKQNKYKSEMYPVLATTHDRIQIAESIPLLQNQLKDFSYFNDKRTINGRRYDLIIDESPDFYELNKINRSDIDNFIEELEHAYKRYCKGKESLIAYFKQSIKQMNEIIGNSHTYFDGIVTKENYIEFRKYEDMFNQNYYGSKFMECLRVLSVMKYGGKLIDNGGVIFPVYRSLHNLPFKKIIFDGTSPINKTYPYNCRLIRVPETRDFSNVTVHWCKNNNLSKSFYQTHPEYTEKIVNYIKENISHEKIFFVTFKNKVEEFKGLFDEMGISDNVLTGHCNATKGKNEFNQTTCAFIGYNLYKGDDFYLYGQYDKMDDIDPNDVVFNGSSQKRTAYIVTNEIDSEGSRKLKLSDPINDFITKDKAVDLVQEIFRTAIRKYNQEEKIDIYIFNTDEDVINELMNYIPNAKLEEWKPFDRQKKSVQFSEYDNAIAAEFKYAKIGHEISTVNFRNKYNIKRKTFSTYQKMNEIQAIHDNYGVARKGNFFVKVN